MNLSKIINRYKLKNTDFTIFSNNCIAGFIYQRYGMKYLTPTIGINIEPSHFIKFCKNYTYYLSLELQEAKEFNQEWFKSIGGGDIKFPVGKLGDINIYFQHSNNFEKSKADWERRKTRINYDNIYMILYDTNRKDLNFKMFETIEHEKKLYLYHKGTTINSKYAFYIKNFDEKAGRGWWSKINKYNPFSKKYFEQFNYTKWFNSYN